MGYIRGTSVNQKDRQLWYAKGNRRSDTASLAQGYTELEQKVNDIKDDVSELKENVPLYSCDIDEIQQHVKRRVVNILGGKQSEAYSDNSIRHKTFSDIWTQLKREYGCVSTYKEYQEEVYRRCA